MKTHSIKRYRCKIFFSGLLISCFGLSSPEIVKAAQLTLRSPECSKIQEWVATIDLADEYLPLKEAPRDKLPTAYGTKEFAELFGKPALAWTREELRVMYDYILGCGKNAGKEFRKKVRPFSRNLRRILIIQSQNTSAN